MTVNVKTGFDDGDRLLDIRKVVLNPLAVKVASLEDDMSKVKPITGQAFTSAERNLVDKTITLHNEGGDSILSLDGMFREGSDLQIVDDKGTSYKNVTKIDYPDANLVSTTSGEVEIHYEWDKLVKGNQDYLDVQIGKDKRPVKDIKFAGDLSKVQINGDTLDFNIPDNKPVVGKLENSSESDIDKIILTGDLSKSSLLNGVMTIDIPTGGGGGGGLSSNNFKGFFSSLGDIISEVKDPVNGKSYAFALDSSISGNFYTPYFYINSNWTELKQDPALLYTATTAPNPQGVFSIKPDPRINIDSSGQLDLSGLATDEAKLNFHGFYDTQSALEAAVPTPILDKSFAYIKHTNGAWIGKVYRNTGSVNAWQIMAPIGAISLVSPGSGTLPAPFYGFHKNEMIDIDTNGLATINGKVEQTIRVSVRDFGGTVKNEDVTTLQFMDGESYVTLGKGKAYIQHPQRVIEVMDSDFEDDHNESDYMGNIFYDKTSKCWIGWSIPDAAGGVDKKWTRIAHRDMSDHVKDLYQRLPSKAPYVEPGIIGDAARWEYTGWSYVKKDVPDLPEEFRGRCGAYYITIIQDVENDTPRPQERFQICYADEEGATSYVRKWNRSATTGDYGWRPWVKISMSKKDIDSHNTDPNAHKNHHKFYKVSTLNMTYQKLKSQNYVVKDSDMMLIADSHGLSTYGEESTPIPYSGSFKISGRFEFNWWVQSQLRATQWVLKVFRIRNGSSTQISDFTYNHTNVNLSLPPVKWDTGKVDLEYGDKIKFTLQCLTDSQFSTQHPDLAFAAMKTFFVIEDFTTGTGSRIAETHRKTSGTVNALQDTGVNVHYNSGTSGSIRVYGVAQRTDVVSMTKV